MRWCLAADAPLSATLTLQSNRENVAVKVQQSLGLFLDLYMMVHIAQRAPAYLIEQHMIDMQTSV
jgi:hypothetical protein